MVEGIAALLLLGAVGIGSVAWHVYQRKAVTDAWGEVARTHDLYFSPPALFSPPRLSGTVDEMSVRVVTESRRAGDGHQRWTVLTVCHSRPARVGIRTEGALSSLTKTLFTGHDVEVGSPRDDADLHLSGSPAEMVAVLDAETRSAARGWLRRGGTIDQGEVSWQTRGIVASAYQLQGLLTDALGLARALRSPDDVSATLATRCLDATEETGVRLRALSLIGRSSASTQARLHILQDPRSPVVLVREALRGSTVGMDATLLHDLLARPDCPGSALAVATSLGVPVASERVARFLRRGGEDAQDAAAHLRQHPDASLEQDLLTALRTATDQVRPALIDALSVCGTLASVESLLPLAEQATPAVQSAARRAIATLQQDADPAARGGLTMSGPEGGLSEVRPRPKGQST